MTQSSYTRQIDFEAIFNFRDLGGYQTFNGRAVAWRRLFRSGNLGGMTRGDLDKLNKSLGLTSVLDLRSGFEIERQSIGLLSGSGIKYFNIPLIPDGGDRKANERRYQSVSNMGEFYINLSKQKKCGQSIVEALRIIAIAANHPLVFHCSVGKDRTGVLAALLLSVLKVADEDISRDFSLSAPYMGQLTDKMKNDKQMAEAATGLPDFFWQASPNLMDLFLTAVQREYGSTRRYLEMHGAETSLFDKLEMSLLV